MRQIKKQSQCHSLYAPSVYRPPIKQIQSSIAYLRSAIKKRQEINNSIALQMFYSSSNQYQRMIAYKTKAIKSQASANHSVSRSLHRKNKHSSLAQRMKQSLVERGLRESENSRYFMDIRCSRQENPFFYFNERNPRSFDKDSFLIKQKFLRKEAKITLKRKKYCESVPINKQNRQPKSQSDTPKTGKNPTKLARQSFKGFSNKVSAISGKIGIENLDKSINRFLKNKFQQNIIVQED